MGVDLYPRTGFQDRLLRVLLNQGLASLLEQIGADNTITLPARTTTEKHTFNIHDAVVQLETRKTDYTLRLYAPGTENLGREAEFHQSMRRMQCERGVLQNLGAEVLLEEITDAAVQRIAVAFKIASGQLQVCHVQFDLAVEPFFFGLFRNILLINDLLIRSSHGFHNVHISPRVRHSF